MILEQKWNILAIVFLTLGLGMFSHFNQQQQKCPDEHATFKEQTAAVIQWSNDFYEKHPDASISDWSAARREFYEKNKCIKALQRVADYESGNVSLDAKKAVDDGIEESITQQMTNLLENREYEEVIALSEEAIQNYPNSYFIWAYRALAFYLLGDCEEAKAAAHQASITAPEDSAVQELLPAILKSSVCAKEDFPLPAPTENESDYNKISYRS